MIQETPANLGTVEHRVASIGGFLGHFMGADERESAVCSCTWKLSLSWYSPVEVHSYRGRAKCP